jgi:hypothetical protein
MIHKVFTVHDAKAEAYLPPFYMRSNGEAIRAFADSITQRDHAFHKHPEDFTLFEVGTYDDVKCKFDIMSTPQPLGKALDFMQTKDIEEHIDGQVRNGAPIQPSPKRTNSKDKVRP